MKLAQTALGQQPLKGRVPTGLAPVVSAGTVTTGRELQGWATPVDMSTAISERERERECVCARACKRETENISVFHNCMKLSIIINIQISVALWWHQPQCVHKCVCPCMCKLRDTKYSSQNTKPGKCVYIKIILTM